MIGDWHIFVIRAQRIVRIAAAAAVPGMVNAGKKIGEVADRRRQMQPAIAGAMQQLASERFKFGTSGSVRRKQREDLLPQRPSRS